MTNSTTLQRSEKTSSENTTATVAYVLNFLGVIVGGIVAASSLATLSPIGFFAGVAGVMFCLDGVR